MVNRKKFCNLNILVIFLVLLISGCSTESSMMKTDKTIKTYKGNLSSIELEEQLGDVPKPSEDYQIGVVLKTLNNEHWQEMKKGYEDAAKKYGIVIDIQAAASESDLTGQLAITETMLNKGYDLIAVSPLSQSNLQPALEKAKQLGVPVINVDDSRVDVDVFVGGDHTQMGVEAAEYMEKMISENGKVAQVEGVAGAPAAQQRIKGFKETIDSSDHLELVASLPGNWDRIEALNVTTNILKTQSEVKAFYANNDTMALGVVEALENEGRIKDIIVIGNDGVPDAIESIRKGKLTATIATFPYDMGYSAVEVAIRLLEGQEVPSVVVSKQLLINRENVDEHFPK